MGKITGHRFRYTTGRPQKVKIERSQYGSAGVRGIGGGGGNQLFGWREKLREWWEKNKRPKPMFARGGRVNQPQSYARGGHMGHTVGPVVPGWINQLMGTPEWNQMNSIVSQYFGGMQPNYMTQAMGQILQLMNSQSNASRIYAIAQREWPDLVSSLTMSVGRRGKARFGRGRPRNIMGVGPGTAIKLIIAGIIAWRIAKRNQ